MCGILRHGIGIAALEISGGEKEDNCPGCTCPAGICDLYLWLSTLKVADIPGRNLYCFRP
jgi:hypothetical protein